MSTRGWTPPVLADELDGDSALHAGAITALALLSAAWLSVLYHVADVTIGAAGFLPLVALAALAGAVVGRAVSGRTAFLLSVGLLAAGLGAYLLSVPPGFFDGLTVGRIVRDQISFLTGYSVLGMVNAGIWAYAVLPGPLFLTAYFAARAEYVRAATVGAATLGFFVLTGDSGSLGTMLGVLGAAGALGFGTLADRGGRVEGADAVGVAVAAMIVGATVLGVAPTVANSPINPGSGPGTVEASLVSAGDSTQVGGSIRLSPEVRFSVTANESRYWRVGAYDRYTGDGWVRTGGTSPFEGRLDDPPGPRERLEQRVSPETELGVLPAAAEPVAVEDADAVVTALDTLRPDGTVTDNYTAVSLVQAASEDELAAANGPYPDAIRERYLGLPGSTPERVGRLTENVTDAANATTPYERAAALETYLERTKEYSLNVSRPRGSVADAFLFEMERGYCVYYATTMTTMLRTQSIPARYVVGYTDGQQVSEDRWVVRGLDSHAWVEVYLPDYGWTRFDPTPAAPRSSAEQASIEAARERGDANVDTPASADETYTSVPTTTTTVPTTATTTAGPTGNATPNAPESTLTSVIPSRVREAQQEGSTNVTLTPAAPTSNDTNATNETGTPADADGPLLPPVQVLALWTLLGAGVLAAVRRSGLAAWAYRAAWLRYQPNGDPKTVIEGAYDRVEFVLERRHRPRESGETVREYLDAIDAPEPAHRVARLREAARYGGEPDESDAEEARRLVDEVRRG